MEIPSFFVQKRESEKNTSDVLTIKCENSILNYAKHQTSDVKIRT